MVTAKSGMIPVARESVTCLTGSPIANDTRESQCENRDDAANPIEFENGDQVEICQTLISKLGPKGDLLFDECEFWRYLNTGRWGLVTFDEMSKVVQGFSGAKLGKRGTVKISQQVVEGVIRLAKSQLSSDKFFAGAPRGIAFRDGFLMANQDGLSLQEHSRENRVRQGYGFDYECKGEPVQFLRMLSDVFRDDPDREDKVACLLEFAGACLLGIATKYQRGMFWIGSGANGKSAVIDVLRAAMPDGTVSAIPPQKWGDDYHKAMLAGKLFNTVTELPEGDIISSDSFKSIIAGDAITARNIFKTPFEVALRAGHLFACNRLPGTSDHTDGFWRRSIVIGFNRNFENDPNKDPDIAKRIIRDELPQIVRVLLSAASRLIAQGKYTLPSSHTEHFDTWKRCSNPVAMFVDEKSQPFPQGDHPSQGWGCKDMYDSYVQWSESNGFKRISSKTFKERMESLGVKRHELKTGTMWLIQRRREPL